MLPVSLHSCKTAPLLFLNISKLFVKLTNLRSTTKHREQVSNCTTPSCKGGASASPLTGGTICLPLPPSGLLSHWLHGTLGSHRSIHCRKPAALPGGNGRQMVPCMHDEIDAQPCGHGFQSANMHGLHPDTQILTSKFQLLKISNSRRLAVVDNSSQIHKTTAVVANLDSSGKRADFLQTPCISFLPYCPSINCAPCN